MKSAAGINTILCEELDLKLFWWGMKINQKTYLWSREISDIGMAKTCKNTI